MDFITKLPRTAQDFDSIWVVVDMLTKSAHFIPIAESISAKKLVDIMFGRWYSGMECRCLWSQTAM